MKKAHTKKASTRKHLHKKRLKQYKDVASFAFAISGIAALWFAISYTDTLSAPIHAATVHLLLADDLSSSDGSTTDVVRSAPPDVRKVFDTTPPVISAPTVVDIAATTATIKWKTDEFATSQVRCGRTESYDIQSTPKTHLDQDHVVGVFGLLPKTDYICEISGRDHDGNFSYVGGLKFTTLEAPIPFHAAASSSSTLTCLSVKNAVAAADKRGTFALAIFNALRMKTLPANRQLYADVPVADPSFKAVIALQRAGLMQGYNTTGTMRLFGAADAITETTKGIVIARAQKKGLCE